MDGITNHNINDAHKIHRVVRSQPPQPLKEQLNREQNSRSFGQRDEKQNEGESANAPFPTHSTSDHKAVPIKETVTISLERYEALKQSQEKQERIEQLIRQMCDYRLVSVKGDHAAYQLLVNSQAFMGFIQKEILEQETIQITDIQWNQPKEK